MAAKEDVLNKTYELLLYLVPELEKFPKSQKFLLADRIQTKTLEVLEYLIEGYYRPHPEKIEPLRKVNLELEKLRYLVRLSHDLRLFSHQKYGVISEKVNEVGRIVGGWIKSLQ